MIDMEQELNEKLYRQKKRKFNFVKTYVKFMDDYFFTGLFVSILVCVISIAIILGIGYLIVETNPWIFAYIGGAFLLWFIIQSIVKFCKSAEYDTK